MRWDGHKKKWTREYYNKYARDYRRRQYEKLKEYFGHVCWICEYTPKNSKQVHRHEINGVNHENSNPSFYLNNIRRFILLCTQCHTTFHKLMDFGYSFKGILEIFGWKVAKE